MTTTIETLQRILSKNLGGLACEQLNTHAMPKGLLIDRAHSSTPQRQPKIVLDAS
jgi:hypothetical protein